MYACMPLVVLPAPALSYVACTISQVGSIWARGLYALERSGVSEKEHMAVYSRALASGLQVTSTWLSTSSY
jgi:hypothetical protein